MRNAGKTTLTEQGVGPTRRLGLTSVFCYFLGQCQKVREIQQWQKVKEIRTKK